MTTEIKRKSVVTIQIDDADLFQHVGDEMTYTMDNFFNELKEFREDLHEMKYESYYQDYKTNFQQLMEMIAIALVNEADEVKIEFTEKGI